MVLAEDNPLAISIVFDPPYFSLDTTFKLIDSFVAY